MTESQKSAPTLPPRLKIKPESEILSNWKSQTGSPVVSICCATYNHDQYIEDAICGFLAQETDFPFEIIIRDDASDDRTTAIVLDYASRYPKILRPVVNVENKYQKGVRPSHVWPKLISGKYLALCEGDDFWTSPHKLQKQVDLLERHQDAVMSVALTHFFRQNDDVADYVSTTRESQSELIHFSELQHHYFHTSTYVISSALFGEIAERYFFGHTLFGDTALRAILISRGPFAVLPEVVSVYRITGNGIWSSLNQRQKLLWEFKSAYRLATLLSGEHRIAQREKFYGLSKALFILSLRSGNLVYGLKWGSRAFQYGLEKTLHRVMRRGNSLF